MKKIVIASGYFNPIHVGHINYFKEAKKLGDILVVIVNNDEQVKIKGSTHFMPAEERINIIRAIKYVDEIFLSIDKDGSVKESLKAIAKSHEGELFVVHGGDRHKDNVPEAGVCNEYGIKIIDGVGGDKIQSSSWLLNKVKNNTL